MRTQILLNFNDIPKLNTQFQDDAPTWQMSNVSNPNALNTNMLAGFKGFQLSKNYEEYASTLDGSYKLYSSEGYPGYVSYHATDSEGWTRGIVLSIYLQDPPEVVNSAYLSINFDSVAGEYAKSFSMWLEGRDDSVVNITTPESQAVYRHLIPLKIFSITSTPCTLRFTVEQWSKPYTSVKITRLSTDIKLLYTGKDLVSFECSENILNSQLRVEPGVCEQYVDCRVCDYDGIIRRLAETSGVLDSKCAITVQGIDAGQTRQLGSYEVTKWNVDSEGDTVGCEGTDRSARFDDLVLLASDLRDRTLHTMLGDIFNSLGEAWQYADTNTENIAKNISTPYFSFDASTLRERLDKLCSLGFLRIYWADNTFYVRSLLKYD